MPDAVESELLAISQQLLDAIEARDWEAYAQLCDPSLTAFEPEASGSLVEGLPFHRFYFDLPPSPGTRQSTISSPRVRVMGDSAVVAYVRLVQRADEDGSNVETIQIEETRVWQRQNGRWVHVHFHRARCRS